MDRIGLWTEAINNEINFRFKQRSVSQYIYTLYIGGGSPNLIGISNFISIIETLKSFIVVDDNKEFTVEINPGAVDYSILKCFKDHGVNRISIGCQSFDGDELRFLGRIHNVNDIWQTIDLVKKVEFPFISLDLIYGIPGQTLNSWESSFSKAISADVDHLSLYNLTFEEGTYLKHMKSSGEIQPVSEEMEWKMFDLAHQILKEENFIHYEVSNWAKPGCQSIHNSVYWNGGTYWGFGPSAHSFDGYSRWWNCKDIDAYIDLLKKNQLPVANLEKLTREDKKIECLMLGLRTEDGVDTIKFEKISNLKFSRIYELLLNHFGKAFEGELGCFDNNRFKLTHKGWFLCDTIIENLLKIIERV